MSRYKKSEIRVSPHLMKKLFETIKDPAITPADFDWMINNLTWMSKEEDVLLTIEEFDIISKKPTVM